MFNRQRRIVGRNVLISLFSDNAVSGVCTYAGGKCVVLRGATVHTPGADPAPADGEVLIDRANVDFIQLL